MLKRFLLLSIITAVTLWSGCGSGNSLDAVLPECRAVSDSSSHQLWGLWQFAVDPGAGTMDAVALRDAAMHLNALHFLEPPPFLNLSLDSLEINGNIVDAVIGLRNPFLGQNKFTGFDVCGIFITHGSIGGFDNPNIVIAGPGDTHLTNPDGYTRWWNPAEFPYDGSMFSYKDGLLGTPDSSADFNSTVNAYKLFCDDLDDPDDSVGALDPSNRCVFGAGQKNTRRYLIQMSGGLVFNYAVDASWKFPDGTPPYDVPGDFAPRRESCGSVEHINH